MKLNQKDQAILANLYDSTSWQTFRKHFLEQRQMDHAQAAAFLPNMDQVLVTRGRIIELKDIESQMAKLKKAQDKRENS